MMVWRCEYVSKEFTCLSKSFPVGLFNPCTYPSLLDGRQDEAHRAAILDCCLKSHDGLKQQLQWDDKNQLVMLQSVPISILTHRKLLYKCLAELYFLSAARLVISTVSFP